MLHKLLCASNLRFFNIVNRLGDILLFAMGLFLSTNAFTSGVSMFASSDRNDVAFEITAFVLYFV